MEIFKFFSVHAVYAKFQDTHMLLENEWKFRANLKERGITDSMISTLIVRDILSKDILSSLNDEEFKLLQGQLTVGQVYLLRLYKNKVNELTPPKTHSGEKGKYLW